MHIRITKHDHLKYPMFIPSYSNVKDIASSVPGTGDLGESFLPSLI